VTAFEVNFDGLVGPTHHYGGLSAGNLASQKNRLAVSRPRQAALEGLAKMKRLHDLGLQQAVLPPHNRPHFGFLRQNGMQGSPAEMIAQAARTRPDLLSTAYSAASMWAANAATVSPSTDTADGRVHFTPANLISTQHRALEGEQTTAILREIFGDSRSFLVHEALPRHRLLADEGAANQMRLCTCHQAPGVEIFVYGRDGENPNAPAPRKFAARQSLQASERIAALHTLVPQRQVYLQQSPDAIDLGVFHNDVIAVSNEYLLLCHERAFVNQKGSLQQIRAAFNNELIIEIREEEVPLADAVRTYLFNSQLLTLPDGQMLLLCPMECESHPRVRQAIDRLLSEDNPIRSVEFIDVRQSMRNGGGPACLRLRVVLTEEELARIQGNVRLTPELYEQLCDWVRRHYREELSPVDLEDPRLIDEVRSAMSELAGILQLTSILPPALE